MQPSNTVTFARLPSAVCAGVANICLTSASILTYKGSCSRHSRLCSLHSGISVTKFQRSLGVRGVSLESDSSSSRLLFSSPNVGKPDDLGIEGASPFVLFEDLLFQLQENGVWMYGGPARREFWPITGIFLVEAHIALPFSPSSPTNILDRCRHRYPL